MTQGSRLSLIQPIKASHLARKTAAAHTKGEWVFCLDGDDEVTPDFLEQVVARIDQNPVDILHLGITVIPETVLTQLMQSLLKVTLTSNQTLLKAMISCALFMMRAMDRSLIGEATQRLYRGELFRSAFAEMTSERLVRAEDAYEVFILADKAQTADGFESCRGFFVPLWHRSNWCFSYFFR